MDTKIVVLGDVHGEFNKLNAFINRRKPDIILQCGDFGFWPGFVDFTSIKNYDTVIYACDGNHENHEYLKTLEKYPLKNSEVKRNVFYMKRGVVVELHDGRRVLFMGGAASVDRQWRTPGFDWFVEETIKESDLDDLPQGPIDIVISHTAPTEFGNYHYRDPDDPTFLNDSSRVALQLILEQYKPSLWFHGHYHKYATGKTVQGCEWYCLNHISSCSTFWKEL